jgi:hypothetical protein
MDHEMVVGTSNVDMTGEDLLAVCAMADRESGGLADDVGQQPWSTGGGVENDKDGSRELCGQSAQQLVEGLDAARRSAYDDDVVSGRRTPLV